MSDSELKELDVSEVTTPDANDAFAVADRVSELKGMAKSLVRSGLLPDKVDSPEKAIVIILQGRELGIPMMQSFQSIDVIKGNPTVKPRTMIALAEQSGELDDWEIESDEEHAVCTVKRDGRSPVTEEWTLERASSMKTKQGGKTIPLTKKFNWRTMPRTMLEWRAIGGAFRKSFPDVIGGIYTPDEAETAVERDADYVVVDEDGEYDDPTDKVNEWINGKSEEDQENEESSGEPDPPEEPSDETQSIDGTVKEFLVDEFTKDELQEVLDEADLKTSGTKDELAERLLMNGIKPIDVEEHFKREEESEQAELA